MADTVCMALAELMPTAELNRDVAFLRNGVRVPRKRTEQALVAVVREAYARACRRGRSTRRTNAK